MAFNQKLKKDSATSFGNGKYVNEISADYGIDLFNHCQDDQYCDNSSNFSCLTKKQLNESCNSRYACMSGHCLDTKCVSCDIDSDCAHYSIDDGLVICHDGKCVEWEKLPEEVKNQPEKPPKIPSSDKD